MTRMSGSLEAYRRKRDFGRSPEPSGNEAEASGRLFVVHKHDASRLHYDFRLQFADVLRSWAVPRGPSLDPSDRRLAVHVEDHPLDYGSFEGVIPEEEYGGGTVLLWDRGEWKPGVDPDDGYRKGKLKFELAGEKLRGGWVLVRMGKDADEDDWLLIKERDGEARHSDGAAILEERPESVASGRGLEAIAGARDRVWRPETGAEKQGGGESASGPSGVAGQSGTQPDPSSIPGAIPGELPDRIEPQLAMRVKRAPAGEEWIHEIKLDGYRILCRIEEGRARLITRRGQDWTGRIPSLARAAAALPLERAAVDGELVYLRPDGTTSFQDLQKALGDGRDEELAFFAFDLLHLDGHDLRESPLFARKAALRELLGDRSAAGTFRYSDHVRGQGEVFYRQTCRYALEGAIAKRRERPYRPGRSDDWRKIKCLERQEFVIGGFTDPSGARSGFGSLLLGVHGAGGRLRYCGRVGTGFDQRTLEELAERLRSLLRDSSPFADSSAAAGRGVHWTEPELVAEVEFREWTEDGVLRQPSFRGLREERSAGEVVLEEPGGASGASETHPSERDPGERASSEETEIAGVRLTHPDRILYAEEGITKRALADHYLQVAERMLPHVAERPIALLRCPRGHTEDCFFQKRRNESVAEPVKGVNLGNGENDPRMMVDSPAGLVALVQMGTLEIHPWGSRVDRPDRPDRLIFDLDPGPRVPWRRVVEAARELRGRLRELGLESFLKTTGGKGLHVVVPLIRRHGWGEVKAFSEAVARAQMRDSPDHYTVQVARQKRRGKILLDFLRNARGATAVAPYSTRARAGAPVAVPVAWGELDETLRPDRYRIENLGRRLGALEADPWERFGSIRQSITKEMRRELDLA